MQTKKMVLATMTALFGCDIQEADAPEEHDLASDSEVEFGSQDSHDHVRGGVVAVADTGQVMSEGSEAMAPPSVTAWNAQLTPPPLDQAQMAVAELDGEPPLCGGILFSSPNRCNWERVSGTSATMEAECDASSYPISGGCWTSSTASLRGSMPNAGSPTDGVNDETAFPGGSGWTCNWSAAAGANTHYVWAMCCGAVTPHSCD